MQDFLNLFLTKYTNKTLSFFGYFNTLEEKEQVILNQIKLVDDRKYIPLKDYLNMFDNLSKLYTPNNFINITNKFPEQFEKYYTYNYYSDYNFSYINEYTIENPSKDDNILDYLYDDEKEYVNYDEKEYVNYDEKEYVNYDEKEYVNYDEKEYVNYDEKEYVNYDEKSFNDSIIYDYSYEYSQEDFDDSDCVILNNELSAFDEIKNNV
jgi:hypothetical protein